MEGTLTFVTLSTQRVRPQTWRQPSSNWTAGNFIREMVRNSLPTISPFEAAFKSHVIESRTVPGNISMNVTFRIRSEFAGHLSAIDRTQSTPDSIG
jgi:hypothetical protein